MFAVFCIPKRKNRAVDPPCLDPLDFGRGKEPEQDKLLRRGRVGLFQTRENAEDALRQTIESSGDVEWTKKFAFIVLECVERK